MAYVIKKKACAVATAALIGAFALGKYALNTTTPAINPQFSSVEQTPVGKTHQQLNYTTPQDLLDNLDGSESKKLRTYVLENESLGMRWNSFNDGEKLYVIKQGISELDEDERNRFLNDYFEDAALARGKSALRKAESAVRYMTTPQEEKQPASLGLQQKNQQLLEERLR